MSCGGCPEASQESRRAANREVPPGAHAGGLYDAHTPVVRAPVADPYEVLPVGATVLPAGEPDVILRVAVDRLRAGLPPILILTGQGYDRVYAAQAVQLHGPSRLERVERAEFSVALRTRAAVEVV